jgi:hypothetical protein
MYIKKRFLAIALAGIFTFGCMLATITSAKAINLGGFLAGAGIVVLINNYAPQLNNTINKLTSNSGVETEGTTKVVPIISIGGGAYVGAAQVSGPEAQVQKVKAVAQLETGFSGKTFRIKALVPVESKDVIKNIKRIKGVGVSAIIDVRI